MNADANTVGRQRPGPKKIVPLADWRKALRARGDRYAGDELNVLTALRACPELAGLVRFNEFEIHVELTRAPPWRSAKAGERWTDQDDLDCHAFLQAADLELRNRGIVADVVERIARDSPYHPVRAYLQAQSWDLAPRLDTFLERYFGAIGPTEYLSAAGRKFLISAVARIMRPGCKADHVLVLESPQGKGKTRAHRILFQPWVTDNVPHLADKDAAIQLVGVWGVELAELAAMRRSEIETTKAFITRTHDRYRPPYGRRTIDVPRQCVFVATTNESHYLRDPTGNRRFWPVRCTEINLAELAVDRDQLWAEAVAEFNRKAPWHLTPEESALATAEQGDRQLVTELEFAVAEYLERMRDTGVHQLTMRDVLAEACNLDPTAPDYAERAGRLGSQVAAALERCAWKKVKTTGRGDMRRTVYAYTGGGSQGFIGVFDR